MNWTDRYLEVLGMERSEATYGYLQRLIEAQLHRIPFEICSKYHRFAAGSRDEYIPSKERFLEDAIHRGWGGNCYVLNIHFGELLRTLGFDARYVRFRGGNAHLAIMAVIGPCAYYVDVGYMAPLFEPLQLESQPHFTRCGEEIIVTRAGENEFVIDRRTGGQSFVVKTIEWIPVSVESFADDIDFSHRDEDENPFMRRIVATVFRDRIGYQVVNDKLMIKSDSEIRTEVYANRDDWVRMMQSVFGMKEEDLLFCLRFLAERNVILFPPSA